MTSKPKNLPPLFFATVQLLYTNINRCPAVQLYYLFNKIDTICFLKMPWCDPPNRISIYLTDFFQLFFPTPIAHLMNFNN